MDIKTLTPDISVTGQIAPGDLADIAARGFRTVICNRPDGEGEDQPEFAVLADAAGEIGLETRHIPVVPGQMTQTDVQAFAAAMENLPKPVLAFCKTGGRSEAIHKAACGGDPA